MSTTTLPTSINAPTATQFVFQWHGTSINVKFTPEEFGALYPEYTRDHIEIFCDELIPITETGYRSHFVHPDEITKANGVEKYIIAWLYSAFKSPEWQKMLASDQQPSLFWWLFFKSRFFIFPGSTPKRNICLLMEYDFCLRIWWAGSRALSRSDAQHP